jgi:uncharacterized protein
MSRDATPGDDTCDPPPPPVVVPHHALSADALQGLLEAFVLREGTDYGERELSLEHKVAEVRRQLERKEAEILFDPTSETVNIVVSAARRDLTSRLSTES